MQILVLPVIVRDLDAQVKHMKEKKVFLAHPRACCLAQSCEGAPSDRLLSPGEHLCILHTVHSEGWRQNEKVLN